MQRHRGSSSFSSHLNALAVRYARTHTPCDGGGGGAGWPDAAFAGLPEEQPRPKLAEPSGCDAAVVFYRFEEAGKEGRFGSVSFAWENREEGKDVAPRSRVGASRRGGNER